MTTILIKKKDTAGAPAPGDLTNAAGGTEIAVNTATKRIYTKDSGGNVVELGTNSTSSTIDQLTVVTSTTLSYGTANQVQYLNASKLLVGSANLTFNGTTLTAGGLTTTGTTSTGVLSVTGNTTLGDASADTVTINGTITSNLIFTDNTYDIGASGATRPRSLFLGSNLNVAGTSTLTGNVGIGAANATSAKLQVSDVGRFGTYLQTGSRYLQLDYDTSATSSWNFGNYDFATAAITQDFIYNRFNGTSWNAQGVLRLRTGGNVSMNYNLSVATTDSNAWGTVGFRAVQLFDLTGGSFAGSGYSAYVSANTYNDGAGWLRVGASFAPSGYQQFDGSHIFQYAATGAAGSAITFIKALETTKTGSVSIPGFLGINATPSSSFAARIGNNGAQIRLERADNIRYRADFQVSAGQFEINAYDDTAGVFMGGLYSFSNHTWQYGTVTQAAAATINTSGTFATTFDAFFNSVRVGRGVGNVANNTAVGAGTLVGTATGQGNTAVGWGAGGNITSSPYNTAVGLNALACATGALTGADGSTAFGVNALFSQTSGNRNTVIGRDSGYNNLAGSYNTYLGYNAGFTNNNSYNVFIGNDAGKLDVGSNNTYVGNKAGANATGAYNYNTFLGDEAGFGHTTGGNNTFVGVGAAFGANTLTSTLVIGQYNIDSSKGPGEALTSGSNNTYVGGFTGNQHTLDTRGLSQQVVISDGAGYPVFHNNVSKIATNNFGHIDVTFNSSTTGNVVSVANGTSVSFFGGGNNFSGLILINDISTTGSAALFITGGHAAIFKIAESSTSNHFQATSTPTGQITGCYMSGTAFTITQNSGGTINYRVIALRTRVTL